MRPCRRRVSLLLRSSEARSANSREQLGRQPLLHKDTLGLDHVGDQREPGPFALLPLHDDAGVRAGGVWATAPL